MGIAIVIYSIAIAGNGYSDTLWCNFQCTHMVLYDFIVTFFCGIPLNHVISVLTITYFFLRAGHVVDACTFTWCKSGDGVLIASCYGSINLCLTSCSDDQRSSGDFHVTIACYKFHIKGISILRLHDKLSFQYQEIFTCILSGNGCCLSIKLDVFRLKAIIGDCLYVVSSRISSTIILVCNLITFNGNCDLLSGYGKGTRTIRDCIILCVLSSADDSIFRYGVAAAT